MLVLIKYHRHNHWVGSVLVFFAMIAIFKDHVDHKEKRFMVYLNLYNMQIFKDCLKYKHAQIVQCMGLKLASIQIGQCEEEKWSQSNNDKGSFFYVEKMKHLYFYIQIMDSMFLSFNTSTVHLDGIIRCFRYYMIKHWTKVNFANRNLFYYKR